MTPGRAAIRPRQRYSCRLLAGRGSTGSIGPPDDTAGKQTPSHEYGTLHFPPAYVFICWELPRWSIHSPWVGLVDVRSGMGWEIRA